MFFLLRMAFWLGVFCVLLPSGGSHSSAPGSQISATQAVTLASAAVSDVRGFCDRQPDACVVGGKVATALGYKAEAGARTLYEFITARLSDAGTDKAAGGATSRLADNTGAVTTGSTSPRKHARMVPVSTREMGTLKPADLDPAWHEPVPLPPRREARANRPSA